MSQKEADRLKIITQAENKIITVQEASELLSLSERQVYRIIKRIREKGGKESNRGYPGQIKEKVISIYRKDYSDYGPTLFSEMLIKYHNLSLDHETLRRWLRAVATTTLMRKKRPHMRKRERRSCFGELLQFDVSYHDWFDGRGAESCLLNCVDDATGKVYLKFAKSENMQDIMLTMWEYINRHGIPRSMYTDRASVYYAEGKLIDFGRAMKEISTELIFAKSPQAKGRVERYNRTFQDRLVKALRR